MVKILSQSGNSLADTYNVVGSSFGIERLETQELSIVHEMGTTVFSERFSTFIRSATSGAINASASFNVVINDLPAGVWRILSVFVFADVPGRANLASVALHERLQEREIPFWVWDTALDESPVVRFVDDGAAVGEVIQLRPTQPATVPHITAGGGQPQRISDIAFRGNSGAFGAGTVTIKLLLNIGFAAIGGLSSRGLPIPSW